MSAAAPELVRLTPTMVAPLATMLLAIQDAGEADWFKPHPFTEDHLADLCATSVRDLYYIMTADGAVLGYGLLRGWDEGFQVPSLGIAIHPKHRGKGLGLAIMHFLHSAAQQCGAVRIRLRVSRSNLVAASLYRSMGYKFDETDENDRLITGFKDLRDR